MLFDTLAIHQIQKRKELRSAKVTTETLWFLVIFGTGMVPGPGTGPKTRILPKIKLISHYDCFTYCLHSHIKLLTFACYIWKISNFLIFFRKNANFWSKSWIFCPFLAIWGQIGPKSAFLPKYIGFFTFSWKIHGGSYCSKVFKTSIIEFFGRIRCFLIPWLFIRSKNAKS